MQPNFCLLRQETKFYTYHNAYKFSDRKTWANAADLDQIAPGGAGWSESSLFAIPSAAFRHISSLPVGQVVFLLDTCTPVFAWTSD